MRFRNEADNNIEQWNPKRGDQIPYRGGVIHHPDQELPKHQPEADPNLAGKNYSEDAENVKEQELPGYGEPEEKPPYVHPIPVDVVSYPNAHEYNSSTYREVTVSTSPIRILGRNRGRTRTVLSNDSSAVVFLGDNPGIMAGSGNCFRMGTDTTLELYTHEELYAVTESSDALVSMVQEFTQRT